MFTLEMLWKILSYGLLMIMLVYVIVTIRNRHKVSHWGRRLVLLWSLGLIVCIVVAMRDQYVQSVMALTDPSITPGLIAADGIQSNLCVFLGIINMLTVLTASFIKKPAYRKSMFMILVVVIVLKVLIIELSILL
jgi:hypothetical protein